MFGKKSTVSAPPKIVSLVDQETRVEGNLYFTGGLQVDGEIRGQVNANTETSVLIVTECGSIRGQVNVPVLNINGSIYGPVRATCLEMGAKARIVGDVTYSQIQIELGAIIEGRMLLADESKPAFEPSRQDRKDGYDKNNDDEDGSGEHLTSSAGRY